VARQGEQGDGVPRLPIDQGVIEARERLDEIGPVCVGGRPEDLLEEAASEGAPISTQDRA
jgi:hypothetical protein